MTIENLWGDLPPMESTRSPRQVLLEQASKLSEATKNLLEGRLSLQKSDDQLIYHLSICVPLLDNYVYDVLNVRHSIIFAYPSEVFDLTVSRKFNAVDESGLLDSLRTVLQSDKLRKVIAALMRQAHEAAEETANDDAPF